MLLIWVWAVFNYQLAKTELFHQNSPSPPFPLAAAAFLAFLALALAFATSLGASCSCCWPCSSASDSALALFLADLVTKHLGHAFGMSFAAPLRRTRFVTVGAGFGSRGRLRWLNLVQIQILERWWTRWRDTPLTGRSPPQFIYNNSCL